MTFTKHNLAAAVSGAFVAGVVSQQAFGTVDVDGTAGVGAFVANESVLGAASVIRGDGAAENFALFGTLTTNNIPANTDVRVTVTLNGGYTFAAAPSLVFTSTAGATGPSNQTYLSAAGSTTTVPTAAVFTGGGTADSSVTFNANSGNGEFQANAHFRMALAAGGLATGGVQSDITADIGIQIADNFGPTTLPGYTAEPYITWAPTASIAFDSANDEATTAIDVVQDSLFFSGGTRDDEINVGGWIITEFAGTNPIPVSTAGTAIDTDEISERVQGTIVAANGFAAFNQTTASLGSITRGGVECAISTADLTAAVCASYNPAGAGDNAGDNDITLTVGNGTANTVKIDETTLVANVAATAASTSYTTNTITGSIPLVSLARNGSSARLNFALTPGGAYPMFIRVTNPSAVSGPVTLTLINDDGVASTAFDITTIAGGPAADLAAGASTGLIPIADVFAAAQAADATFDLGATNKLRIDAVAEFGGAAATQGVVLSAFNQSTDGSNFIMMTDASN